MGGGPAFAEVPCLDAPEGEARACLRAFSSACLAEFGGGVTYRECLWAAAGDSDAAVLAQSERLGRQTGLALGMGVIEDHFADEVAAYRAMRDARCDRDAAIFYQTGTAGASYMGICRLSADVLRLRELERAGSGPWYDTWPEWP